MDKKWQFAMALPTSFPLTPTPLSYTLRLHQTSNLLTFPNIGFHIQSLVPHLPCSHHHRLN